MGRIAEPRPRTIIRPMLAMPAESERIIFPVYASPKIDGIRGIVLNASVRSRTMKLLPNTYTQGRFGKTSLESLDGEFAVGDPWEKNVMQATASGVMRVSGTPDIRFYVFDYCCDPEKPYVERYEKLQNNVGFIENHENVFLLKQVVIQDQAELEAYEVECLSLGYEGIMIRSFQGRYKYGRSTVREGYLLKVKRFQDSEATVVGFEELRRNDNEAKVSELGLTTRSSHASGKSLANMLGALILETPDGVRFGVGTGFTEAQRIDLWAKRTQLVGRFVTYKHFSASGVKEAPRLPVFKGFRYALDMEES